MVFMCQNDSFLQKFETEVVSFELAPESELKAVGIENLNHNQVFRLIPRDTIIFPEGGGQPDDRGTLNGLEVIRSIRKGTQALHYVVIPSGNRQEKDNVGLSANANGDQSSVNSLLNQGDKVLLEIDWNRRFDHMQQHSGQHLITAIADKLFGFPTTSWWLGSEESYIELDTPDISPEQISEIEKRANAKIRLGVPVTVDVVELDDPKLQNARGRNLPEDVKGQIRIVTMNDIESNVCCGTHVTTLSQLQVIKLLNVVKKKGKCLLHFLCGERVIGRFHEQFQREQSLMGILKSNPADFVNAADKLNIGLKNARKSCQVLSKDLATLEAKKICENGESLPKFWAYHRDNVDLDFVNALLRELGTVKTCVILVTVKTEGSLGHMMLVGGELEKEQLSSLGDALCQILDGKGNVRGNVYQAKVSKINNVKKAVKLAEEFTTRLLHNTAKM